MTTAFGARLPPYSVILDLDRKIRDFPVPKYLQPNCDELENPSPTPHLVMQRWIILSFKESSKSEYEIRCRFLPTDDPTNSFT
jgi:hypothetical protein